MNRLSIHVDDASELDHNPLEDDFDQWGRVLTPYLEGNCALCLKLVSADEMRLLNGQFRGRQGTTNVLSFPVDQVDSELDRKESNELFLGDIAICASVVREESEQQGKQVFAHWTHLFLHGALHLLGYDHISDEDAQRMEELETTLLAQLQIASPYEVTLQASAG